MSSSKTPAKKRSTLKKINTSQPSQILKQKQIQRLKALLAEQKRQEQMRKEFELFLKQSSFNLNNNNNNNWYFPSETKKRSRKTRKLRR